MPPRGRPRRSAASSSPCAAAAASRNYVASSRSAHKARTIIGSGEVELLMDCEDDDLEPCQKAAYKKAENAYRAAMDRIASAKANAQGGHVSIQYLAAGAAVPPVASPASVIPAMVSELAATPSGRPARRAAKKAVDRFISMEDNGDDVVILDDESTPARRGRGRGRGARANTTIQPGYVPIVPQAPPVMIGPGQSYQIMSASEANQLTMINRPPVLQQAGLPTLFPSYTTIMPANPGQQKQASAKKQRKRAASIESSDSLEPATKKGKGKGKENDASWVPLDEYYYGKKEGDPAYREEKGEFRFKCWYCHKMLYNNVRIMVHMQGHIDSDKQQNLDLSDLTQCKHCYKQFDTPFEMQSHVEKIHQKKTSSLVCRVCEKDHDNQSMLRQHMKAYHNACEMPYICQLCNFRSSVFDDVVDHFKKRHDSSQHVLCFYCLKVFKVQFSKTTGWGLTQNYYQHLQKHQTKATKKCSNCKLNFINKVDAKLHKQKDHLPNFRGTTGNSLSIGGTSDQQVMIKVPFDGTSIKSLNAPSVAKVTDLSWIRVIGLSPRDKCKECGINFSVLGHFKKNVECSLCRYATACNNAYSNHMLGFHSGNQVLRKKIIPHERSLGQTWHCLCGYSTDRGSTMANHLVRCSKRTCYQKPPEQRWFEYDDEQEEFNPNEPYVEESEIPEAESPEKDVPALFGMLGLVKKTQKPTFPVREVVAPSPTPNEVAGGLMTELLDNMFPAEAEAAAVLERLLANVDQQIDRKEAIQRGRRGRGKCLNTRTPPSLIASKAASDTADLASETASVSSNATETYADDTSMSAQDDASMSADTPMPWERDSSETPVRDLDTRSNIDTDTAAEGDEGISKGGELRSSVDTDSDSASRNVPASLNNEQSVPGNVETLPSTDNQTLPDKDHALPNADNQPLPSDEASQSKTACYADQTDQESGVSASKENSSDSVEENISDNVEEKTSDSVEEKTSDNVDMPDQEISTAIVKMAEDTEKDKSSNKENSTEKMEVSDNIPDLDNDDQTKKQNSDSSKLEHGCEQQDASIDLDSGNIVEKQSILSNRNESEEDNIDTLETTDVKNSDEQEGEKTDQLIDESKADDAMDTEEEAKESEDKDLKDDNSEEPREINLDKLIEEPSQDEDQPTDAETKADDAMDTEESNQSEEKDLKEDNGEEPKQSNNVEEPVEEPSEDKEYFDSQVGGRDNKTESDVPSKPQAPSVDMKSPEMGPPFFPAQSAPEEAEEPTPPQETDETLTPPAETPFTLTSLKDTQSAPDIKKPETEATTSHPSAALASVADSYSAPSREKVELPPSEIPMPSDTRSPPKPAASSHVSPSCSSRPWEAKSSPSNSRSQDRHSSSDNKRRDDYRDRRDDRRDDRGYQDKRDYRDDRGYHRDHDRGYDRNYHHHRDHHRDNRNYDNRHGGYDNRHRRDDYRQRDRDRDRGQGSYQGSGGYGGGYRRY